MEFSLFGQKFTQNSGILELMDDLGRALAGKEKKYMLGGGNPAHIPGINQIWRQQLHRILESTGDLEALLGNYDTPQGNLEFLDALAALFRRQYAWDIDRSNLAITAGSQNGFFLLFNLLAGDFAGGQKKRVLFPLAPEYIGYADQALGHDSFVSHHPRIEHQAHPFFKYFVDFDSLQIPADIGALCVSRPTNPTGNVLTDGEVARLAQLAEANGLPLIIDNAYGAPFPSILFEDITPVWNPNIILSMSLSKLGLPAVRTGIILARPEIISALTSANAILNLANSGIGQRITLPLVASGAILDISKTLIQPFYRQRRDDTLAALRNTFGQRFAYHIHQPQGALFLWLWFPQLKIDTKELYERLKQRHVVVVPGHYFFFGMDENWPHSRQCIRINYSQNQADVERGLAIIAEEVEKASG